MKHSLLLNIMCSGGLQWVVFALFAISIYLGWRGYVSYNSGSTVQGNADQPYESSDRHAQPWAIWQWVFAVILLVAAVIALLSISAAYKGVTC